MYEKPAGMAPRRNKLPVVTKNIILFFKLR